MDGTLYLGGRAIAGAAEFIAYLRASGRAFLFFTNNPTRDAAAYADKLQGLGIDASPAEVLTAGEATVRHLLQTPHRRVYAVANPSFAEELRQAGFTLTGEDPEAVVLAFDPTLTYDKLATTTHWLRAGLPYIATNPDRVCPTEDGYIPDCGAMAALLESATGRTPEYIGKPNAAMVRLGLEKLGVGDQRAGTAMVGDRLYTDIAMAHAAGITGVLVLSGETSADEAAVADPPPDHVCSSVAALHAALEEGDRASHA